MSLFSRTAGRQRGCARGLRGIECSTSTPVADVAFPEIQSSVVAEVILDLEPNSLVVFFFRGACYFCENSDWAFRIKGEDDCF